MVEIDDGIDLYEAGNIVRKAVLPLIVAATIFKTGMLATLAGDQPPVTIAGITLGVPAPTSELVPTNSTSNQPSEILGNLVASSNEPAGHSSTARTVADATLGSPKPEAMLFKTSGAIKKIPSKKRPVRLPSSENVSKVDGASQATGLGESSASDQAEALQEPLVDSIVSDERSEGLPNLLPPTNEQVPDPIAVQENSRQPITLLGAIQSSLSSGQIIRTSTGDAGSGSVTIETISEFNAQILSQEIGVAKSVFDPLISSQLAGNKINQPTGSFFGPGLQSVTKRDEAEFNTRLSKQWSSGAVSSIGYEPSLAYLFFPGGLSTGLNPLNSSDLVTQVKQPLLRGGGQQTNLATIRIAKNRVGQSLLDVEEKVQRQLLSIEEVYWRLHAAHVRRQAIIQAIAVARKNVEIAQLRFEAKRIIYTDVARAFVQLENLLQQQAAAQNSIQLESLRLASLAGITLAPNTDLVPLDEPERKPIAIDLDAVKSTAISNRPDLKRRRLVIEAQKQQRKISQNQLLPQLDLRLLHRTSGLSDTLSGSLSQMSAFDFNSVTAGMTFSQTLGTRLAQSNLRSNELQIARENAFLHAFEQQVGFDLASTISEVQLQYQKYESAFRQVEQTQKWMELSKIRYEQPPTKNRGEETLLIALADFQTAIQAHVDAVVKLADALAAYNTDLASVEQLRGTMLDKWRIKTVEDSP